MAAQAVAMRIGPVRPAGRLRLSHSSRLRWTMLRMISLNALAAFTQEVTRNAGIQPVRAPDTAAARNASPPPQRTLGTVPLAGSLPPREALPRGSLLDLRV